MPDSGRTAPCPENEDFVTILTRLEQWKEHGIVSPEQHTLLAGLSRGEPFFLFFELNILLYAGVLAFVAGLGWTISTWSRQLGDVLVLAILSAILAACFWYCFSRAPAWSPRETPSPSLMLDYVLYLGSLVWSVELLHRESVSSALRTMGSLFVSDRRPLLLPRLSSSILIDDDRAIERGSIACELRGQITQPAAYEQM